MDIELAAVTGILVENHVNAAGREVLLVEACSGFELAVAAVCCAGAGISVAESDLESETGACAVHLGKMHSKTFRTVYIDGGLGLTTNQTTIHGRSCVVERSHVVNRRLQDQRELVQKKLSTFFAFPTA